MRGGRGRLGRGLILRAASTSSIPAIVTSPPTLLGNIGGDNGTYFIQTTAVASGSFTNLYVKAIDRYDTDQTTTFDLRLVVDGVALNQLTQANPSVFVSMGTKRWYGATTITTPASAGIHTIEMYLVSAPLSTYRCEAGYFVVGSAPASIPPHNVPAFGGAIQSNRWRNGLVDYVAWPGGSTRPVNTAVPRSVVTTIGLTSAGVTASDHLGNGSWYQEIGTMLGGGLYMSDITWSVLEGGHIGIKHNSWQGGENATVATPGQRVKPSFNGGRLASMNSGYSTIRWTSTLKAWVVSLAGELAYIDYATGEKVGVAGRLYKTSTVPLHEDDWTDAEISVANYELVGSAVSNGVLNWNAPHDVYPYPNDENTVLIADSFNHRLIKVNTSLTPPTATMLVGFNGKGCAEGNVSVSAKINRPYAIWIHPDNRVFFCCTPVSGEQADSAIFELSADETTLRKVVGYGTSTNDPSAVFRPFWMCEFTSGNILSLEHATGVVKKTDYTTGVTSVWVSSGYGLPDGWLQIVCDTVGAVGPQYDVFLVPANANPGNISLPRYSVSAVYRGDWLINSVGAAPTGPCDVGFEPHGHYPWTLDIHRRYALAVTQGFGNTAPNLIRRRVTSDKSRTYSHGLYLQGQGILQYGTLPGFPVVARPPFNCLRSPFGHTFLGDPVPSWVHLMETETSASIVSYLQAGAGGTVPRPEISGYWANLAMYAMKYMTDADVVIAPPSQPSTSAPAITAWQSSRNGTDLTVNVTFDKPTFACLSDFLKAKMADSYATSHTLTLVEAGPSYVMRFTDADGHVRQTVTLS
jgi:hypothetical protein